MIRLEFEKLALEFEAKALAAAGSEADRYRARADRLLGDIYAKLTPWQRAQVARHPQRPHLTDYATRLFDGWTPCAGDRAFAEDVAILGGPAWFRGRAVMLIGHEKGRDTKGRVAHNFGMAKPEGYRKAVRLIGLASRMGLPIISLVDTPGAFPGVEAEERGQSEAIARATEACLAAEVPMVAVVVGEGGSGGAVAIAAADRVLMLEHAIYSVISPEGASSILWRTADRAKDAADALKLTAADLRRLGLVDGIVREPVGGAHRDLDAAAGLLGDAIEGALAGLAGTDGPALKAARRARFLSMGRISS